MSTQSAISSAIGAGEQPVRASASGENSSADATAPCPPGALRSAVFACAALIISVGAAALLGWVLHSYPLTSVLPGYVTMKPNTGLGFVAAGAALATLLFPASAAQRWSKFFTTLVVLAGGLALFEYIFRIDLQIDELLFHDYGNGQFPGRMAPITAALFCVGGASLFLLSGRRRARKVAQYAALFVLVIAFAAIVGYLFGVPILYGSKGYTSMAFQTGVGFLVLGLGLVLSQPESRLIRVLCAPESGGWLARRFLPLVVLVPIGLGWVYMRRALNFGSPRFGMALFAVTLAVGATVALWYAAMFLNRSECQAAELVRVLERSDAAVRQSERELQLVTDHVPMLLAYIDKDSRLLRINRTHEQWLGLPLEEIMGKTARELFGEAYWQSTLPFRRRVLQGERVTFETMAPTVQGNRHVEMTFSPDIDEAGQVRGIACMVIDLDERRQVESTRRENEKLERANKDLQELATTDELTGLNNRRAFEERLRTDFALAIRHGRSLSLLMIDIDDFKLRNDTWGHAAGDEVLRKLGALLPTAIRTPDFAARYGGEEFTILLPESNVEQARVVAQRIRSMVGLQDWTAGEVTLSLGISSRTEGMSRAEQLVKAADAALYQAKRAGKDRVCYAEAGPDSAG